MRVLVLGGIRSGKSLWAERAALAMLGGAAAERMRYIATGPTAGSDTAWAQRVADHRQRRPDTWQTRETADVATELRTEPTSPALVDDLGGWLTAALDRAGWERGSVAGDVEDLIGAVDDFRAPLVLVSPEVGLSVVPATAVGGRFADELGRLNQRLAECCERVVLVVAGQPLQVKPATEAPS